MKLLYDVERRDLSVTVLAAGDLRPRDNGQLPNPYCKLYLLPERKSVAMIVVVITVCSYCSFSTVVLIDFFYFLQCNC
jgi:hypothetical protein